MHGEYKMPGGKLVAVDFEIEDAALRQVMVHGDFFLYPDDALAAITNALDGAPAALSVEALADRVAMALPEGAEWLGSSPGALAVAVRRALGDDNADLAGGRS